MTIKAHGSITGEEKVVAVSTIAPMLVSTYSPNMTNTAGETTFPYVFNVSTWTPIASVSASDRDRTRRL